MISKKYKTIFDITNALMIYLLALSFSMGACTIVKEKTGYSFIFTAVSAVILVAFIFVRKLVAKQPISMAIHIAVCAVLWFAPFILIDKVTLVAFAALLTIVDMNDFAKKKQESFGEIHIATCVCFVVLYAFTEYAAQKGEYSAAPLFTTLICLFAVLFFALSLVRAYVSNAMKLVGNAHMDEDVPVAYMYGNSNKFIGPIIVLIVAIMLVIQSTTSVNIIAAAWFNLLSGVAMACNSILFLNSTDTILDGASVIAAPGTTQYIVEVVIAAIIVVIIVAIVLTIIYKVYKSHWRKDISADETLESAAMVEKREWIYHKESKKKVEDTSVTSAAEIPTEIEKEESTEEEQA